MANSPFNMKSRLAASGTVLKITPSNSPMLKPSARSPNKPSQLQSSLSLQTVIGTTTSSSNGFDSHEPSKSFALCAGSAVILAEFDEQFRLSQRFFRARPTATSINPVASFYHPSTPTKAPERRKSLASLRPNAMGGPLAGSPNSDWADGVSSRTWTSRERIKAATSVSLSRDGRLLAVGEVPHCSPERN